MTTKFKFENFASMSAATLTADDGGRCYIFCAVPGGTPQFTLDIRGPYATPCADAPYIGSHKDFVSFVKTRFAD